MLRTKLRANLLLPPSLPPHRQPSLPDQRKRRPGMTRCGTWLPEIMWRVARESPLSPLRIGRTTIFGVQTRVPRSHLQKGGAKGNVEIGPEEGDCQDVNIMADDNENIELNSEIDGNVYMKLPEGIHDWCPDIPRNSVCKLRKALHGLKQAPRLWYGHIDEFLRLWVTMIEECILC
jgi:hypothetical protein